jgi:signal transduction histidine kinase
MRTLIAVISTCGLIYAIPIAIAQPPYGGPQVALTKAADVDDLVSRMMAFDEGAPLALGREDVSLDELLWVLIEDCALEAALRGCHLKHRTGPLSSIHGERELLHRAIENVVRNAIRRAPRGTAFDVGLQQPAQGVAVFVRDYGPSVPEELLGAIFEPFFRNAGSGLIVELELPQAEPDKAAAL